MKNPQTFPTQPQLIAILGVIILGGGIWWSSRTLPAPPQKKEETVSMRLQTGLTITKSALSRDLSKPEAKQLLAWMRKIAVEDGFRTDDFAYFSGVETITRSATGKTVGIEITWRHRSQPCRIMIHLSPDRQRIIRQSVDCQ